MKIKTDQSKTAHPLPLDSAGRIMITQVPVVQEKAKILEVEKMLISQIKEFETIDYIYIVNEHHQLKGALSIKELFRQPKERVVGEVMIKELITAGPYSDQERVVYLALKHNLKAIPVVDKNGLFLGTVPSDVILHTIQQEASEDILRLVGIRHPRAGLDNVLNLPILQSLKHRLPWLLIGLLGGITAASIIGRFEDTLAQNLILVAFIPLVVYMADAVGTQMEAFIIRDLAVNPNLNFARYFLRQLLVILLIGLLVSLVLFSISFILYFQVMLSLVLATALLIAVSASVMTGLIIPYTFEKLRLDPANASGPVATIIQDTVSVLIYFLIASRLL